MILNRFVRFLAVGDSCGCSLERNFRGMLSSYPQIFECKIFQNPQISGNEDGANDEVIVALHLSKAS